MRDTHSAMRFSETQRVSFQETGSHAEDLPTHISPEQESRTASQEPPVRNAPIQDAATQTSPPSHILTIAPSRGHSRAPTLVLSPPASASSSTLIPSPRTASSPPPARSRYNRITTCLSWILVPFLLFWILVEWIYGTIKWEWGFYQRRRNQGRLDLVDPNQQAPHRASRSRGGRS